MTELKDLREENKVLISECDRLIKEKGELLSKVSGGDVLRICQLEEQLKNCKEEYANLNKISYGYYKELKEAKQLLKMAVEDLDSIYCKLGDNCEPMPDCGECPYIPSNQGCYCKWRYVDIALKLIGDESNK